MELTYVDDAIVMESERKLILDNILSAGWSIAVLKSDEWWVREMWQVESAGATAYVTFLVDPADMAKVWAVLATRRQPIDYAGEPPRFVLPFERLDIELTQFIGFLNESRNQDA